MREFIDKTTTQSGTPINRKNLMAIQGFDTKITTFGHNSIVEENIDYETLTTVFEDDGSITETFVGAKTIIKHTYFNSDGSVSEVLEE